MEIRTASALEIGRMIKERRISSVEATQAVFQQIDRAESAVHAYAHIDREAALAGARAAQRRIDAGEALSPLAGVPMALKDNICAKGMETTCASRILQGFRPPYSATAYRRLSDAGAVLLGHANMDEFAMGGSTETSCYGPTRNPWDITRVPGGSSGGSAAAVAAGEAPYALGSDTGGSIRQPCAFCGVSGIKPTYGAVSRYGLIAYASSLDQIGPIGRTVEDCAAVLSIIGGHDPRDSTCAERAAFDFTDALLGDVRGLKIGLPEEFYAEGLEEEVRGPVIQAARLLEGMGAELIRVRLPLAEYAIPAYYVIACAEASSNLSRYDGVKYGMRAAGAENLMETYVRTRSCGFGMEVKRRIMLGSFVLSSGYYDAYYKKAMQAREMIQAEYMGALQACDMLLAPCSPTAAYRLGENMGDPLKMYLGDIYTVSINLAGLPAVALPCGFSQGGMPVGMQLIGRPFEEPLLVRAAHAYQMKTDHHLRLPEKGGAPK